MFNILVLGIIIGLVAVGPFKPLTSSAKTEIM
jgi:hypothetical protein